MINEFKYFDVDEKDPNECNCSDSEFNCKECKLDEYLDIEFDNDLRVLLEQISSDDPLRFWFYFSASSSSFAIFAQLQLYSRADFINIIETGDLFLHISDLINSLSTLEIFNPDVDLPIHVGIFPYNSHTEQASDNRCSS
ncbi:MAG: hypothetical protein EZS28_003158 [Streblomastix strix]|uniref:Uncharacterized protein n=1 Tax=Streblomastix strix TaxID=222440 RepID=A0A5J4X265_9EUKA|nr:MAG: hypothetical protein EZS28_003158 [Streblomastix strix]